MNRIGIVILSIWLILKGLVDLFHFPLPAEDVILPLLAIASGVVLLTNLRKRRLSSRLAVWALAFYLILSGLFSLLPISFAAGGLILGLLAIAAGVLLIIER